jgi:uncharacterized membrane protein YhdT
MKKWRKIIAPIVITVLICAYLVSYIIGSMNWDLPVWGMAIGIGVPLLFMGVCIFVLVERIKEIRSGEEDDLSKY